jgi:hypothetical protein
MSALSYLGFTIATEPVGTVFCVIRVHFADAFDATATAWP